MEVVMDDMVVAILGEWWGLNSYMYSNVQCKTSKKIFITILHTMILAVSVFNYFT